MGWPRLLAILRTVWMIRLWEAWVPWEKFKRTMSTPFSTSAVMVVSSELEGPNVATIFVFFMVFLLFWFLLAC